MNGGTTVNKNRQSEKQRLNNANYLALSKLAVAQRSLLSSAHANRRLGFALMLLPVSLLLSGCNHLPTQPCEPQPPTPRPASQFQLPSVSYSLRAQEDIEGWRKRLTPASLSSAPSLKPLEEKP